MESAFHDRMLIPAMRMRKSLKRSSRISWSFTLIWRHKSLWIRILSLGVWFKTGLWSFYPKLKAFGFVCLKA